MPEQSVTFAERISQNAGGFGTGTTTTVSTQGKSDAQAKAPATFVTGASVPSFEGNKSLTVTYSRMATSHTTIGAERFHFRVRKGIGWFPLAMAARQTG